MNGGAGGQRAPSELGAYYDRLSLWTRLARPFGYGGGSGSLTVHRLLADPRAGGGATATRVHDLIAESIPALDHPRILDAGCGLGGTMFDLADRLGGSAVGLTLSESQRATVVTRASARGLSDRVSVRVASYDTPPSGPFDLVVAIESLAHSPDPSVSTAALAAVLGAGAAFVVVDDMPEAEARSSPSLQTFREGWKAPILWGRSDYLAAFARLGLAVVADRDLTEAMTVRTVRQISRMERVNRAVRAVAPRRWQVVLDSYYGGLALERLYREGRMRYRLLAARRVDRV